jgi:hypothetical protein
VFLKNGAQTGGKFHPKLNIDSRPIVNKYREGKVKRTLKKELKVPEIAGREANETSFEYLKRLCFKVLRVCYDKTRLRSKSIVVFLSCCTKLCVSLWTRSMSVINGR